MMLIHLVAGAAVVLLAVAAGIAFLIGRPSATLPMLAGWALGLLIVQATTGMFLLTATEEGPGPWHIGLPLVGLAIVGAARLARSPSQGRRDPILGVAYSLAAIGAAFALVTGLATG